MLCVSVSVADESTVSVLRTTTSYESLSTVIVKTTAFHVSVADKATFGTAFTSTLHALPLYDIIILGNFLPLSYDLSNSGICNNLLFTLNAQSNTDEMTTAVMMKVYDMTNDTIVSVPVTNEETHNVLVVDETSSADTVTMITQVYSSLSFCKSLNDHVAFPTVANEAYYADIDTSPSDVMVKTIPCESKADKRNHVVTISPSVSIADEASIIDAAFNTTQVIDSTSQAFPSYDIDSSSSPISVTTKTYNMPLSFTMKLFLLITMQYLLLLPR